MDNGEQEGREAKEGGREGGRGRERKKGRKEGGKLEGRDGGRGKELLLPSPMKYLKRKGVR